MSSRLWSWPVRARAVMISVLALMLGIAMSAVDGSAHPAEAAGVSAVASRGAAGATADALPTVQVNGIVWTQVVVGNTVYAAVVHHRATGGRRAGEERRAASNLLAFDIRTGELITVFAPSVNGAVRALAASPDRKTLYIGGCVHRREREEAAPVRRRRDRNGALRAQAPAFSNEVRAILAHRLDRLRRRQLQQGRLDQAQPTGGDERHHAASCGSGSRPPTGTCSP